jgi:hypothetical protein
MMTKERMAGENAVKVQREIADAIVAYCDEIGISQQEFGTRLGLSAGTANHNIRNFTTMSPSFILATVNSSRYFRKYKLAWFKALAEDHGLAGGDVVSEAELDAARMRDDVRRALIAMQGELVQLINSL